MKYWSEILKKVYDSEKECVKAEAEFKAAQDQKAAAEKKKAEERKVRAKEVEDAFSKAIEATKTYNQLKDKFCKDYGSFHMTFSTNEDITDILNGFDEFFRFF